MNEIDFAKFILTEIAVFQTGLEGKPWVIRHFGALGSQLGDKLVPEKPTEEELRASYGDKILITWRYEIVGKALFDQMNEAELQKVQRALSKIIFEATAIPLEVMDAATPGSYTMAKANEQILKRKLRHGNDSAD